MDDSTKQMISAFLGSTVRHAIASGGAVLAAHGLLANAQQASFTEIGTGVVMGLAAWGWSLWQKRGQIHSLSDLRNQLFAVISESAIQQASSGAANQEKVK